MSDADLEQTLRELEQQFWANAGDAAFYREQLAEDSLMVFPAPFGLMEREPTIAAVEASPGWERFELRELRLLRLSEDAAVLAYRASAARSGSAYGCYASSVYSRRAGDWKLVLHQQTPIPEGEA